MTRDHLTRRRMKQLTGTAGAAALAGCRQGSTTDAPGDESQSFDGWFDDGDEYNGVADKTGAGSLTVTVGGGTDGFRFDPTAIDVSAGTTVTWEWTSKGGSHNVVAEDGSFQSDLIDEEGHTFEHTFETAGTYRYYCEPHKAMGMKGVVVVA